MKRLVKTLACLSARHPWQVLGAALVISLFAIQAVTQLPVLTSRQALLPQDTQVAWRLNRFLEQFGAASDLVVVLEHAPRDSMESFATELASRLNAEPEIAHATERLDTDFFVRHAYLLIPSPQLADIESLLVSATASNKPADLESLLRHANRLVNLPQNPSHMDLHQVVTGLKALSAMLEEWRRWLSGEAAPKQLNWEGLLSAVGAQPLANGYFASRQGNLLFLFVHAKEHSGGFEMLQPFNERVRTVAETLADDYRKAGRAAPDVVLTGLPAIEYEEYLDIEKDIQLVIWTAVGLIAALILLVVRSLRWALAIFIPMGLGALWSLALTLFTVGHLTIITSSFLAILFGLGADYGIFTSSQIADFRRSGKPMLDAIGEGIGASFSAVFTAAGASLLIFGVLAQMDFPGFAELGIVAASGVLLIVISTWLVQPAVYSLLPPGIDANPQQAAPTPLPRTGYFPRFMAIALVAAAIAGAGLGIRAGLHIPFDYDVLSLLPENSKAAQYQRRMAAESDYQSEVIIFTADNLPEIRRITEQASQLPSIARVQSITDLFPPDADPRLVWAHRMAELAGAESISRQLDALGRSGLGETAFRELMRLLQQSLTRIEDAQETAFSSGQTALVEQLEVVRTQVEALIERSNGNPKLARERSDRFLQALLIQARHGVALVRGWREASPLMPGNLPDTLRSRFVAPDGTLAAYAFPARSVYDPANLEQLVKDVYSVSPEATGFPTTHLAFSKMVIESFSHGTLLAVGVCLLWLIAILRNARSFVLASLPLIIGGGWMLGLMALADLRYNYANIIALPLVIALAVDYGVWYSHRWRELRGHSPLAITRDAGRVIALAAGTELAGLGAISLASYRGVSGLGIAITLGLISCLAATLLVAPAIGQLIDTQRKS